MMKNPIKTFILIHFLFGFDINEFPQNSYNLGNWNGGSVSSNIYQISNPASLPLINNVSLSIINIPEGISLQNMFISKNINNKLIKLHTTILHYGEFEDFVTRNKFFAKDVQIGVSVKSAIENILSIGVQLSYINRNIENYFSNLFIVKFGFRTHLLKKRLGLGLVINQSYNFNEIKNGKHFLYGILYKPMYFPGEFTLDIKKTDEVKIICSILVNINNYFDIVLGFTDDKFEFHTGSTFENIYSGLGLGINIKLDNYKIGFGLRNIGQYGTISGISLGYKF